MGIGTGLYMCDVVVNKFTFAISSPDEFLVSTWNHGFTRWRTLHQQPTLYVRSSQLSVANCDTIRCDPKFLACTEKVIGGQLKVTMQGN